ncbi:MAG: hypothetical protein ACO259_10630 [Bacteroidia bacterium]
MKNYELIKDNLNLKIEVYYNKGGQNYFTYKNEARGYYLSVTPVNVEKRENNIVIECYTAFSGVKVLLNEVQRQSEKGYKTACELANFKIQDLKNFVLSKNNIG